MGQIGFLAAVVPPAGPSHACYDLKNEVAPVKSVQVRLQNGFVLNNVDQGIEGHKTTFSLCNSNDGDGSFHWNWTRGTTNPTCSGVPAGSGKCPYPLACYYQFSENGFYSPQSVNWNQVGSYAVATKASVDWSFKKTEGSPAARVIYDILISDGKGITDEIIINLNLQSADFLFPCPSGIPKPSA